MIDLQYLQNEELQEALELTAGEPNRAIKIIYRAISNEIGRRKALNIW